MKIFFVFFLFISVVSFSQMTQQQYIDTYKDMAISEMKRSNVPASITLAQGLLESSNGNSRLAKEGNNHFGIKCNNQWKGEGIYENDDKPNECFRKYKSVEESYKDHSDFLKNSSRYAILFTYEITDYKSWAKGLKQAGYATSPTYADKLIELIERYNLNQYDFLSGNNDIIFADKPSDEDKYNENINHHQQHIFDNNRFVVSMEQRHIGEHEVSVYNGIDYIILDKNSDVKTIAKELNMLRFELKMFNDLGSRKELKKGEIIYLGWKKNFADKNNKFHIVEQGETLQYISQLYGIKLKNLCKKNNLTKEDTPKIGAKLRL